MMTKAFGRALEQVMLYLEKWHPLPVVLIALLFVGAVIWKHTRPRPGLYDVYIGGELKHDNVKVDSHSGKQSLYVYGADGKIYEYGGNWELVKQ